MCGNHSRDETIQGRKLYEEIRYIRSLITSGFHLHQMPTGVLLVKKLEIEETKTTSIQLLKLISYKWA